MNSTDVQIYDGGVELIFDGDVPTLSDSGAHNHKLVKVAVSPDEFDVLAEQVAEAALNKRGMEWVSRPVAEAEVGWFYGELEIDAIITMGARSVLYWKGEGRLDLPKDLILRFTRPIQ